MNVVAVMISVATVVKSVMMIRVVTAMICSVAVAMMSVMTAM